MTTLSSNPMKTFIPMFPRAETIYIKSWADLSRNWTLQNLPFFSFRVFHSKAFQFIQPILTADYVRFIHMKTTVI